MQADPRLTGYLNRALAHELSAVQQFMLQSELANLWGWSDLSRQMREDVNAELEHARRLMERMLALGVSFNATQLPPARPGRTLEEMLLIDRVIETQAIRLYDEAALYCARVRDAVSHQLFSALLEDELSHLREIDRMLMSMRKGADHEQAERGASVGN